MYDHGQISIVYNILHSEFFVNAFVCLVYRKTFEYMPLFKKEIISFWLKKLVRKYDLVHVDLEKCDLQSTSAPPKSWHPEKGYGDVIYIYQSNIQRENY